MAKNLHVQLLDAIRSGNEEAVRLVLGMHSVQELSQLKDKVSNIGWSYMHYAAECGNPNIINILVQYGVRINELVKNDAGKIRTVDMVIAVTTGMHSSSPKNLGQFPIHLAVNKGDLNVTKRLLQYGAAAIINITLSNGVSLLDLAVLRNNSNMVKLLLDFGADINCLTERSKQIIQGKKGAKYALVQQCVADFLANKAMSTPAPAPLTPPAYVATVPVKAATPPPYESLFDHKNNTAEPEKDVAGNDRKNYSIGNLSNKLMQQSQELLLKNKSELMSLLRNKLFYSIKNESANDVQRALDDCLKEDGFNINFKDRTGFALIHHAIQRGDPEILEILIKAKASLSLRLSSIQMPYYTPLLLAVQNSNKKIVDLLLQHNIDITSAANYEQSIHLATINKDVEVIDLLVKYGADINAETEKQNRALDMAVNHGDIATITCLLKHDAEVNYFAGDKDSPLFIAIRVGNIEIIKLLLEHGADIDACDSNETRALEIAIQYSKIETVEFLLKQGAQVNYLTSKRHSPLALAIKKNELSIVKLLWENKASFALVRGQAIDILESNKFVEYQAIVDFYKSVKKTKEDISQELLQKYPFLSPFATKYSKLNGLNSILIDVIQSADEEGMEIVFNLCRMNQDFDLMRYRGNWHFLHYAIVAGNVKIIELLVNAGVSLSLKTRYSVGLVGINYSPMHLATAVGNIKVLDYLITQRADINECSDGSKCIRPLDLAVLHPNIEILRYLLQKGAEVVYPVESGRPPLLVATSEKNIAVVDLLIKYGADINASSLQNRSRALDVAVKNRDPKIMERLLQHNAECNYSISGNNSPLSMAVINNDLKAVQLLCEYGANPILLKGKAKKIIDGTKGPEYLDIMLFIANSKQDANQPSSADLSSNDSPDETGKMSISIAVSYNDLTFGNKLGAGGFGAVYHGKWQHEDVAIKKLYIRTIAPNVLDEFKNEIAVMSALRHPRIVQLFGACFEEGRYCMVMEYMPKGSLYAVLSNNQPLAWSLRYSIAMDITSGLSALHAKNIFHRDIKSLNVLLDENMRAKLTDFGLSKIKSKTASSSTGGGDQSVGTLAWMAPELFKRHTKYTKASDMYSYGMVLWELATREIPFADASNPALIAQWVTQGEQEEIPAEVESKYPSYAKLIKCCWEMRQENRPTIEEVAKELEENPITDDDILSQQDILLSKPGYVDNLQTMN